jgi:Protein of unknown function (DUF3108)
MRFRKAIVAFVVFAIAGPAAAFGQDARRIELGYEITFAGFAGFRIDFAIRYDGARYDAESRTYKEGLLRALTIHYEGRNRAWGVVGAGGAQPAAGSLSIIVGDKPRTWLAQYGPGGLVRQTHDPDWKPRPDQEIPADQLATSLDPMSAALHVGMSGDSACEQTAPSNDGKRRIDVILKKVGTETPQQAGFPQARGDLLVCEIYTRRVAGEFYDAPKEAETQKEEPMRVWLARLDDTPFRYPVRLEAKTGFGTIRGKTLSFRERPLTEEEKASMGR